MKKNRMTMVVGMIILIIGLIYILGPDDTTKYVQGQEAEYVNFCFETEPDKKVKKEIKTIEYNDYELFVYLSQSNELRVMLLTNGRDGIEWWEHLSFDLEQITDSGKFITLSQTGKIEHFKITLYSNKEDIPTNYEYQDISFDINEKDFGLFFCYRFVEV